jgi:hypothetical protein
MNEFIEKQDKAGAYMRLSEAEAARVAAAQHLDVQDGQMVVKQTANNTYAVLPTLEGAKRSEYEETVLRNTAGSKKAAEEALRTAVRARKAGPEVRVDSMEHKDADTRDELLKSGKSLGENSREFDAVLVASDVLSHMLPMQNLELIEQYTAMRNLRTSCEAYISSHAKPLTDAGKQRKDLVRSRLAVAKEAQEQFIRDNPNFYYERFPQKVIDDIHDGESGEQLHGRLVAACQEVIDGYPAPADPDSIKVLAALKVKLREPATVTKSIMCHFFPTLAVGDRGEVESQKRSLGEIRKEYLQSKMERVFRGLQEMMGDILHWGGTLNADDIREFRLTGSDLHERGLGVSILTFATPTGDQQKVIKPEEKWTEQRLLGSGPDSVASRLNALAATGGITITVNTDRGPVTRQLDPAAQIRTLDMQIHEGHGTMVERVDGVQVEKLKPEELRSSENDQKRLTQIFACITGMDDMHYENLVYEKDGHGSYRVVMIDADNAMSKRIFGHLKMARDAGTGFGGNSDLAGVTGITRDFLKTNVKPAFAGSQVVCRTVPLKTQSLSEFRAELNSWIKTEEQFNGIIAVINRGGATLADIVRLFGANRSALSEPAKRQLDGDRDELARRVIDALPEESKLPVESMKGVLWFITVYYGRLTNGYDHTAGLHGLVSVDGAPESIVHKQTAAVSLLRDAKGGQIPFFEYHPHDGTVTTHGRVIWQGQTLEELMSDAALDAVVHDLAHPV